MVGVVIGYRDYLTNTGIRIFVVATYFWPMPQIRYLLADDDALCRELVVQYLQDYPKTECVKICEDAREALDYLQDHEVDLLILDVEMPGLSGVQLVKSLRKLPYILLISSHSSYALDAFDIDAVDFIKKPVTPERLYRGIEKTRELMRTRSLLEGIEAVKIQDSDHFFIREDNAFVRIRFEEVLYFESLADFVKIHLSNGKEKLALVNLKNLEQQIPSQHFVRISRSHMVNIHYVDSLNVNHLILGKIQLSIGAQYAEQVTQAIVGNNALKRRV